MKQDTNFRPYRGIWLTVLTVAERQGWPNPWLFQARSPWEKQGCHVTVTHGQKPHAFARNRAAEQMLSADQDHDVLIMVDSDVVPEVYGNPVSVPDLAQFVTPTRMVIAPCPIWDRRAIAMNCWKFNRDEDGALEMDKVDGRPSIRALDADEVLAGEGIPGQLVQIDAGGFGVVAIHKETLIEAIVKRDYPFRTVYRADGSVKIGEDIEFCLFAGRELGVEICAAFSYECDHLKTTALLDVAVTRVEIEKLLAAREKSQGNNPDKAGADQ